MSAAAKRYAKAVFDLANESGELEKITNEFRALGATVEGSPELKGALGNPMVDAAQRKAVMKAILDRSNVSVLTNNSVLFITDHRRSDVLPQIADEDHAAPRRRDLPDHQEADPELRQDRRRLRDGHRADGRRRHRPHLRPRGAMAGELVEFPGGSYGLVLNLEEDNVGVAIFGDATRGQGGRRRQAHRPHHRRARGRGPHGPRGQRARPAGRRQGPDRDARTAAASRSRPPASSQRQPVKEPLQTGIKAIDAMIPIGRGQRELIIGDRQTGKTAVAIDAIINQKGKGVFCFYVAIGQKQSTVAQVVDQAPGARRDGVHDRRRGRRLRERRRSSSSRPTPA
jgi:hypothetical protein